MLPQHGSRQDLESLAGAIGKDTHHLLEAIEGNDDIAQDHFPEIQDLKRIYHQQFDQNVNQVRWLVVCSYCGGNKLDSLIS